MVGQLDAQMKKSSQIKHNHDDGTNLAYIVENIGALLHMLGMSEGQADVAGDDGEDVDLICLAMKPEFPMSLAQRGTTLPEWEVRMINLRGRLPLSLNHFISLVGVYRACVERIIDTGGSHTMIDMATALAAGLKVTPPGVGVEVGGYYGSSG